VTVLDTNEAPTDILVANASLLENQPPGTVVGLLTSSDPDSSNTFSYSLVSGTGSDSNAFFTINGTSLEIAGPFDGDAQNTTLNLRIRSTDQGGLWFEKVFAVSVVNTNEAPSAPINLSPANGAVNQPLTPTLQASAFNDPDTGDSHAASQWLVRRVADNAVVFDSGVDATDKTSLAIPAGTLEFVAAYNWQTRHEDGFGVWSGYSTLTAFSTTAPSLTAIVQDGVLVISWPTNASGFNLQHAADLAGTEWNPASPPPVVVGQFNCVTNALDGDKLFYRLFRP